MSRKGNKGQPGNEAMRDEARRSEFQNFEKRGGMAPVGNGGQSDDSEQIFNSDEIAERAYQIFEREGRMDGRDMDHWLQAERELRTERDRMTHNVSSESAPRSARQHQQR